MGRKLEPYNSEIEYTEGSQVVDAIIYAGFAVKDGRSGRVGGIDHFRTADEGEGRKGTIRVTGKVKFMPRYPLTIPPWGDTVIRAQPLPSIQPYPARME